MTGKSGNTHSVQGHANNSNNTHVIPPAPTLPMNQSIPPLTSNVVKTIFSMELRYRSHRTCDCCRNANIWLCVMERMISGTCSNNRSSAQITAWLQSIFDWNGSAHELDRSTGIQPACSASRNRNDPRRRPLGTKQKVEFCSNVS